MNFEIKDTLDPLSYKSISDFLSTSGYYCIEQHPDWNAVEVSNNTIKYFYCTDENNSLLCFSKILLSKNRFFKVAHINLGPVFADFDSLTKSIQYLHSYFSEAGFTFFSIQLGVFINEQTELLEYTINKSITVKYYFKPGNLWSSTLVDLTRTEEEIFKSFSKGHRASINSSKKSGLIVTIDNDRSKLNAFVELYIKMHEHRKMDYDKKSLINEISNISDFINKTDKGFFEFILDNDVIVGALIIIFQGNSARYLKSASDPVRKDISIMHIGLFEAMKYCKAKGCLTFDLWGYNHFVNSNDQLFKVNTFKKGFGGNFTFFPKRMNFELKPTWFKIYNLLKHFKSKLNSLPKI